ncbi:MAG TPA: SDR family NAD(P)-dependent oxidoreductase [Longimicrobiaceae bacterium]|nr:SDR family NAD(P)-dependent oxidoreductase [Longimicrobiaceae bacterium]
MESIAIIGMSGRFPGAESVEEFWGNLREGVESITFFSKEELGRSAVHGAERADPAYVQARGVLKGIEDFDAAFFDFTPREAQLTDPQHRVFLECAWEALESAGYDPRACPGAVGVFGGAGVNSYLLFHLAAAGELDGTIPAFQAFIHNKHDHLTTRVAYKLDLRGPCMTVQTACSTSLVATSLACQALATYQCDMALAGGVNIFVPQQSGYLHHEGGIGSPDGHCRPFDARAAGTLGSNGAGVVALKRLEDALADGDTIHAVIRGWAVNNDGSRKVGYTAPGVESQAEVIATAQAFADVPPETIGYVEAHGTATTLGDPIEVEALTLAFRRGTERTGYCALGSVKSNLGHLDAAAGVAGLIKTVLALKHREIPPSLHFSEPNPRIDFGSTPFYVASSRTPWEADGTPRRAGVSSFGLGGSNAHLVLEEAPPADTPAPACAQQLLVLSARSGPALEEATTRLLEHLKSCPGESFADVAYTLQAGRAAFDHRRMLVARDREEAVALLEALSPTRVVTRNQPAARRPVTFLFPGQGAQYPGMGSGLYESEPVYRAEVDRCLRILEPHLGFDLRALLLADPDDAAAAEALGRTEATQPALFVVEYALARLWMSWGIQPAAMLGHSVGEYVAATLAGVISLEDALALAAERGRLIQALPGGAMLGVPISERKVRALLDGELDLAAVNGDELCVVSGPREAVEAFRERLAAEGVTGRPLHTSHAFHSAMMEPMLEAFRACVREIRLSEPRLPYLSNVTGSWITAAEAMDPEYWVRHVRQTVRFHDAVGAVIGDPDAAFLEVGPGRTLRSVVRWHPGKRPGQVMHASLPHARDREDDRAFLLHTVGQLWLAGAEVGWKALHAGERRKRVPLPTYPFQRKRYWVEAPAGGRPGAGIPSLAKKPDVGQWFWVPTWREAPRAPAAPPPVQEGGWLLFAGDGGLGSRLAERLRAAGCDAVVVRAGQGFRELASDHFEIDARRAEDYVALLARLNGAGRFPRRIVHLWSAGCGPADALDRGLHSLVLLAQALGSRDAAPVDLTVVTAGMQEVVGGDLSVPEQATVLGAVRVIPREYPYLSCRSVDVTLPAPGSRDEERLTGQLLAEAASDAPATVAFRAGRRWVQDYEPLRLLPAEERPPAVREGGVYLVTGGLGGIGLEVSGWLARHARARLVLTGRSVFPAREEWNGWLAAHEATDPTSRRIRAIREMEALGAEVMVARADAADETAMRAVVEEAAGRFGALHGVVHAAGVPSGAMIAARTPEAMAAVLAPKVRGARVLERVLAGRELDFMVLCSSRTAVTGRFGQVDYTAANAFLDAFAHAHRAATGTWTVSVAWGAWEEVGMAAGQRDQGAAAGAPVRACDHPMLERCILEEPGRAVFATDFSVARHWPLDEHRIIGRAVMPGVAYFEMLRAAVAERAGGRVVVIREAFFVEPMHLDEDEVREGRLELVEDGTDEFSFTLWSWDGNNPAGRMRRHAMGRVGVEDPRPPARSDLQAMLSRCPRAVTIAQEDREDDFGPRWQSVHRIHLGTDEVVIEMELPEAFRGDWDRWFFHPAILDRAAGITKARLTPEYYYLPMVYRGIALARPLSGRLFAHGRFHPEESGDRETIVFDFNLMDERGETVLRVESFTQKRINDPGAEIRGLAEAETPQGAAVAGDGIRPQEGVDAFARILAARVEPRVVVSPNDLRAAIAESDAQAAERVLGGLAGGASASAPRGVRPELSSDYAAPRNEIERRIAEVWSEVLGVEQVGVYDNFFELGGDSVQAIQIMARGKRSGLHLTPQQFFQYETIAEMAELITGVLADEAERDAAPGEVPLTPVQHWLMEAGAARPGIAEAVLLEVRSSVDPHLLASAARHVLAHHDALRLHVAREGGAWRQMVGTTDREAPFERVLCGADEAGPGAPRRVAERVAGALDPAQGSLFRVVLLDGGADEPQRVLVVAHPLAVDAASWAVLLDDLGTAYVQLSRGEEVRLPAVPTSFRAWSERVAAESGGVETAEGAAFLPLPRDAGADAAPEAPACVHVARIAPDLARRALEEVAHERRAEAEEVLLAALAEALAGWTGARTVGVELVRDARAGQTEGEDLSRSVGRLEYAFPVALDLSAAGDPVAVLKAVKQRVRGLPDSRRRAPEVSFRYRDLSAGPTGAAAPWHVPGGGRFRVHAAPGGRTHLLEVEAVRTPDGLVLDWSYDPAVHERSTLERLAAGFDEALASLVERSSLAGPEGFAPEDFPLANLDVEALGRLSLLIQQADRGA